VRISVSIVEDDAKTASSLAELISGSGDYRCLAQHLTGEEALEELPKLQPDVVLMDLNLPGLSGVECVRRLKPVMPATQFVMLTAYQNTENIFAALAAGASGYLLKRTPPTELLAAIRDVHGGGSPMNSPIARKVVQFFRQSAPVPCESESLSSRETEVLDLVSRGLVNKEIASELNISVFTVRAHLRRIYEKLQVHCRTEAAAKFLKSPQSVYDSPRNQAVSAGTKLVS
jgi:DNA-binding NarL/FixJ family response regulator